MFSESNRLTALKTLSLRIRSYDEETGEYSNDLKTITGDVINLTKTANNQKGVSLFTDETQKHYKSMVDYLREISKIWDEISEKNRTKLLEKLFGKRGASVGSAIITNFDSVERALDEMDKAGGAAEAEMDIIRQSVDYHLNALQETWTGVFQDIINRGDLNVLIDLLTKLSNVIGFVADKTGLLGTTLAGVGLVKLFKNVKNIKSSLQVVTLVGKELNKIKPDHVGANGLLDTASVDAYTASLQGLSATEAEAALATSNLTKEQKLQVLNSYKQSLSTIELTSAKAGELLATNAETMADADSLKTKMIRIGLLSAEEGETATLTAQKILDAVATGDLTASEGKQILTALGLQGANAGLSISFDALGASIWSTTKALFAFLTTTPVGWAILAAGAIYGTIKVMDWLTISTEEAKEAVEKAKESMDDINSTLTKQQKTVKDSGSRYAELAQHVNQLNNTNLDLSDSEYEEFLQLSDELADVLPNLKVRTDENGHAVLNLNGNIETINSTLDDYIDRAKRASQLDTIKIFTGEGDNEDYFENAKVLLEDYKNDILRYSGALMSFKQVQSNILDLYSNGSNKSNPERITQIEQLKGLVGSLDLFGLNNQVVTYTDIYGNKQTKDLVTGLGELIDVIGIPNKSGWTEQQTEAYDTFVNAVNNAISEYDAGLEQARNELDAQNKEIANYGRAVLERSNAYLGASDTIKTAMSSAFTMIDWSQLDIDTGKEAADYIQNQFAHEIAKLTPENQKTIEQFFNTNPDEMDLSEYLNLYNQIKEIFEANGIQIPISFTMQEYEDVQKRLWAQTFRWSKKDKENLEDYFKKKGINTKDEIDDWNKKTEGTTNYQDAVNQYERKYQEEQSKTIKQNVSFKKEWKKLDDTSDDKYKSLKKDLTDLADSGKLTVKTFNEIEGASDWAESLGLSIKQVVDNINKLTDETKQLSSLKSAIGSIQDAYSEKKENKVVGADTLSSMQETFGKLGKSWENYKNIAGSSKTTTNELKKAQDELATAYVNSGDFLSQLTEKNKDYYASQLKELGIANADEIVNNVLKERTEILDDLQHKDLSNLSVEAQDATTNLTKLNDASGDAVYELLTVASAGSTAAQYLSKLAIQKIDWSNLNASDAVTKLNAIASAAGIAITSIASLNSLNSVLNDKNTYTDKKGNVYTEDGTKLDTNKLVSQSIDQISSKVNKKLTSVSIPSINVNPTKTGSGGSGGNGSSSSKEEFDWIERRITRLTNKISLFNAQKENLFTVKAKNKNLNKQIKQTTKLIGTYTDAISHYSDKANSIKLSSSLKKKVRNGQVTGTYKDLIKEYGEKTAKQISKYQDYYDKAQSAKQNKIEAETQKRNLQIEKLQNYVDKYDAKASLYESYAGDTSFSLKKRNKNVEKQRKALDKYYKYQIKIAKKNQDKTEQNRLKEERKLKRVELNKQKFDNVQDYYSKKIQQRGWTISDLDNTIAEIEGRGQSVNKSYYTQKKQLNAQNKKTYQAELKALKESIKNIKKGTAEWYEARDAIQETKNSISECVKEEQELNNKIRELYDNLLINIREQIGRIDTEQEFLRGLFAHEKNFDSKTGAITDAGIANLVSLGTSYYALLDESKIMTNEIKNLEKMRKDGSWKNNGFNSIEELEKAIDQRYNDSQEIIKNIYSTQTKIYDITKDGYQSQLNALKDLIDKQKESLKVQKDLYDYQRSINEKTNSINETRRQIAAYRGDTSQEGLSKIQKLQKQLSEQEDDLRQTEYDRMISDQEDMLDKLYEQYEELITKKLDEFMVLVKEGLGVGDSNTIGGKSYLETIAKNYGYNQQNDIAGKDEVDNKVNGIVKSETDKSNINTPYITWSVSSKNSQSKKKNVIQFGGKSYNLDKNKDLIAYIAAFVKKYAKTTNTKFSKLSGFNQSLYHYTGKKILSEKYQKELANVLGVKVSNLRKKFHSIGFPGFAKGGVVNIDDITRQIRANGDDGVVSVKNGEGILTPLQTKHLGTLVDNLDTLNFATSLMNKYASIPNTLGHVDTSSTAMVNDINYGGVSFNFDVEGDSPTEIVRAIQNDPKVQRALQSVTVDRMNNSGRLNVRNIK